MLTLIITAATGCSNLERDMDRVSELRDEVFIAQTEHVRVTLITGVREEPFVTDGISGDKKDFSVLTVVPADASSLESYTCRLKADGLTFEDELKKHPLKNSWSIEFDARIKTECAVTLSSENYAETVMLESVKTSDFISAEKAYAVAATELGKPSGEIYIRLIENPLTSSGGYYWYVAFAGENYALKAVLLDPRTGEVAARRD